MPWETADGTVVDHMATERWTDATRTGDGQQGALEIPGHSGGKQNLPVASA